jgi:HD-GYP domain-containing protein (c-di-GMP phosphodiesterase class II)
MYNLVLAFLGAVAYRQIGWLGAALAAMLLASRYRSMERTLQLHTQRELAIQSLIAAMEARDPYTRGHSERVADLGRQLAKEMRLREEQVISVWNVGRLHDVGKIGVPDVILLKEGHLTDEEYERVKSHASLSEQILGSRSDWAELAAISGQHHEWYNGEGYPRRLALDQIRVEARILAIVDAYDAMVSTRSYRLSKAPEEALAEIERCSGTQFDPRVVRIFVRMMRRHLGIAVADSQPAC